MVLGRAWRGNVSCTHDRFCPCPPRALIIGLKAPIKPQWVQRAGSRYAGEVGWPGLSVAPGGKPVLSFLCPHFPGGCREASRAGRGGGSGEENEQNALHT